MIRMTMIMVPMLLSTIAVQGMEHDYRQLPLSVMHKEESHKDSSRLTNLARNVTALIPSTNSLVQTGKTGVSYLTYTTLSQVVSGMDSDSSKLLGYSKTRCDNMGLSEPEKIALGICAIAIAFGVLLCYKEYNLKKVDIEKKKISDVTKIKSKIFSKNQRRKLNKRNNALSVTKANSYI